MFVQCRPSLLKAKTTETIVKSVVCKYSFKIALVLLVAGCASEPAIQPDAQYRDTGGVFDRAHDSSAGTLTGIYANSQPVHNFIQHMVHVHGFSESYLNGLFSRANRLQSVINLEGGAFQPPGAKPAPPRAGSWTRYRKQFITEAHINHGVEFWSNNADAVQKASATYGVDPEYIVAIIGVETFFGRNVGKTRTFDALTTLAFDTQRRAKFFMTELENFLLMTREEGYEPLKPVGSWAGAMGLGQFMPSSFRTLAVDFNQDGHRDLWHQQDAIGSVAHYFARSGWQNNMPVAEQIKGNYGESIIALSTDRGNEYWYVHPNFKVIKKYNNSDKYAMAVHQLAQAIKQRYL
jgi:membrane-bound lytic murein transglycosylase B